jgi:hypothetical protein
LEHPEVGAHFRHYLQQLQINDIRPGGALRAVA